MTDKLFLSREEMVELTGRSRRDAQAAALRTLGIEHKVRADGRVLVLRKHVEQVFGAISVSRQVDSEVEPDWDAA